MLQRKVLGSKREGLKKYCRKLRNGRFTNVYCLLYFVGVNKRRILKWIEPIDIMNNKMRNACLNIMSNGRIF
jgi:hypothetical protein